jgi:hypothetical protein
MGDERKMQSALPSRGIEAHDGCCPREVDGLSIGLGAEKENHDNIRNIIVIQLSNRSKKPGFVTHNHESHTQVCV